MKKRAWNTRAVLAVMALLVGQSLAQPPRGENQNDRPPRERPTVKQIFQEMDQNGDRKLSKSEAKGPIKREFLELDSDSNGFLSEQEVQIGGKRKPSRR